jgi:hypothetical protein
VAFAGSALWLPSSLARRLRSYVADGGRLASFGADAFRRSIGLDGDSISDPSPPRRENAFGERTALLQTGEAPLSVFEDRLGLFDGLSDLIGEFTVFERSVHLPPRSELVEAAGREVEEPAFVGYRLGGGLVLRSGTPQWARELEEERLSVEVPRVTRRIWTLLSGQGSLESGSP